MNERESFLDKLRAAATCAVVMLHTVTGVMDNTDMNLYPFEKKVFLVALDLICWCVPVFLIISGYLFLTPRREIGAAKMLTKYCRRILLALFGFGVPYACLEQAAVTGGLRWDMPGRAFLMVLRGQSWSHLWYLYLILFLYLLTPVLRWILFRVPVRAVWAVLGILLAGCSILPYLARLLGREDIPVLPDGCIYLFYYISGYLFAVKKEKLREKAADGARGGRVAGTGRGCRERAGGRCLPVLTVLLGLGMACSRLSGSYTLQMAYNYPFTVLLALMLFAGGIRGGTGGRIFWKQASELSFAVYLIHPLFLNLAYKFFHVTPLSFPIGISLPLFFAAVLALSAGCAWLLRRIPPLRKYVL